jgi:hypothetical protein
MSSVLAGVTTYLIGVVILISAFFVLKRKYTEDPHFKVYGLSSRNFNILIGIGILIFLLLIISILAGWQKY